MPEENATPVEQTGQESTNQPENFEVWLANQEEPVKKLYEEHVTGLKNTVKATREERDTFKKQLEGALKEAEKGSNLERSISETLTKLEVAEKRAAFFEDAIRPEIGCKNPKVAYALAVSENLFSRSGHPDWDAIKASAPELFGMNIVRGNAGSGTESPPKQTDMNSIIRRVAGVQ